MEKELEDFAEWFNENQWRGGKGDYLKTLFCKCDYKGIIREYVKKKEILDLSSAGSERSPHTREVIGSNPIGPTAKGELLSGS
jgi:hypothetical protein